MRDNLFRGRLTERFADAPKIRPDLVERGIIKDGFVYGSLVINGKKCFICISAFAGNQTYIDNAYATMFEVDPETVGQYTGLTDKNRTMIFEGDIVKFIHKNKLKPYDDLISPFYESYSRNYKIEYTNTFARYGLRFINGSIHFPCKQSTLLMHDCEVIGNIHDNPELLEG